MRAFPSSSGDNLPVFGKVGLRSACEVITDVGCLLLKAHTTVIGAETTLPKRILESLPRQAVPRLQHDRF
jgi:hypothetical protein